MTSTIELNRKQQDFLKKKAHHLKPVVTIGNAGLTDSVVKEIDSSLEHHELLKIKTNAEDKNELRALANTICEQLKARYVLSIGRIIAIYRPAKKRSAANITLP